MNQKKVIIKNVSPSTSHNYFFVSYKLILLNLLSTSFISLFGQNLMILIKQRRDQRRGTIIFLLRFNLIKLHINNNNVK